LARDGMYASLAASTLDAQNASPVQAA